jgi:hypothetical protein
MDLIVHEKLDLIIQQDRENFITKASELSINDTYIIDNNPPIEPWKVKFDDHIFNKIISLLYY